MALRSAIFRSEGGDASVWLHADDIEPEILVLKLAELGADVTTSFVNEKGESYARGVVLKKDLRRVRRRLKELEAMC